MTRTTPRAACALTLLLALGAGRAAAQDGPGDWVSVGGLADERLRGSLWLPVRDEADGRVAMCDALGTHAAMVFADSPRVVVVIEGLFPERKQVPVLALEQATLRAGEGEPLRPQPGEAWEGQEAGLQEVCPEGTTCLASWRVRFPALDPACAELRFSVPVRDGAPLQLRFRRWAELMKEAEADLAAWKVHVAAHAAQSAIAPYLNAEGYRRLRAKGEPVLPALLLRELAAGEAREEGALPRWLTLHALADTEWGRAQGVPDHGDAAVAARVLERWRGLGHPSVPGARPPR